MLLQSGMDRELTNRVIKRAQWLTEQYVCTFGLQSIIVGLDVPYPGRFRAFDGRRGKVSQFT